MSAHFFLHPDWYHFIVLYYFCLSADIWFLNNNHMGKKARMKIFKTIASTLPAMKSPVDSKMLAKGAVDVNHARRLRTIHTQLGMQGMKAYVQNINS